MAVRKSFGRVLSVFFLAAFVFTVTSPARAEADSLSITGKRAKIVGKSAVYGFGGGLVVGLASQAFKRKTKNIFMFGSIGLYAGIVLGIYIISTSSGPAPYEGPDTYEDFGWKDGSSRAVLARSEGRDTRRAGAMEMRLVNLEF